MRGKHFLIREAVIMVQQHVQNCPALCNILSRHTTDKGQHFHILWLVEKNAELVEWSMSLSRSP